MRTSINRILIFLLVCCLALAGCTTNVPAQTTDATTATTQQTVPTTTEEEFFISNLSVGFGRVDISPTEPTPLRGYGYSSGRMSSKIQDPLYATCIALTDSGDNTVLIFTLDLTNSYTEVMDAARLQISERTGIPVDAIMVSATHNHSSPDLENLEEPSVPRYIESLKGWMTQAAVDALNDRALTRVYIASAETENLNFVRRYQLQDGSYAGDNFGNFKAAPIAGHETEVDSELQLVRFQRQGAKDVILANFQTHPHREGGSSNTAVTSDIIGPFREKMESTLDCHFAYFTGGSGNVNPASRIAEENITKDYIEQGHALADYALAAYDSFQEIPTTSVKITKTLYQGKVDQSMNWAANVCEAAVNHYLLMGSVGPFAYIRDYGVRNIYQANAIAIRGRMPAVTEVPTYAVSVGDLAFVAVPFEMFDTNGMQIKDGSPFSMTFVMTCANNNLSYLPSELAFRHGGYSVDVTLFQQGTAEELVATYLDMLNTLYHGN